MTRKPHGRSVSQDNTTTREHARSNAEILHNVAATLESCSGIAATDIGVMIATGDVTLSGAVDAKPDLRTAKAIVADVSGVRSVKSRLAVVPTTEPLQRKIDKRIAEFVLITIERLHSVQPEQILVTVENSNVTLDGTVATQDLRDRVRDAARYTIGVNKVDNRLIVERAEPREPH